MLIKKIMDKPVLPMSILLLSITFYQFNKNKNPDWSGVNPTSCRSAIVPLKKRSPGHWKIHCNKNSLEIQVEEKKEELKSVPLQTLEQKRKFIYNRMANYIVFCAQNSFTESLKNVEMITLHLIIPEMEVYSYIRGEHLALMAEIKSQKILAKRFREWIKTREVLHP